MNFKSLMFPHPPVDTVELEAAKGKDSDVLYQRISKGERRCRICIVHIAAHVGVLLCATVRASLSVLHPHLCYRATCLSNLLS